MRATGRETIPIDEIYLDHSATTWTHPEVVSAMRRVLEEDYGNPSSLHRKGLEAERLLKSAKGILSQALAVPPDTLLFTSGGTEANNLAILGAARALRRVGRHIVTTAVEHPSVLEPCRQLEREGFELTLLPVDEEGCVDPATVEEVLRPDTILVSVMHVNNELGSVQPVEAIGRLLRRVRSRQGGDAPRFHVDAVQSFGKLTLAPRDAAIDLLTVSGHKLHGPKGIGALYVGNGVRLQPLLLGGGQQGGIRPGTENVPGIVGLGRAVELAMEQRETSELRLRELRNRLIDGLSRQMPECRILGSRRPDRIAPHILSIAFPGLRGEHIVHSLAERGVYVSTGSACHSRKDNISHVIKALGLPDPFAQGVVRISLSPFTTDAEIDRFLACAGEVLADLQSLPAHR